MTSSAPPAYIQAVNTGPVAPSILEVHTPSMSFAVQHSLTQENLENLYGKLSRKVNTGAGGERVGPGWLKYEWNGTVWNLDDDSDYAIFAWRQQSHPQQPSTNTSPANTSLPSSPTLHFHNPSTPLPNPPAYQNPSFYLFRSRPTSNSPPHSINRSLSRRSFKSHKSSKSTATIHPHETIQKEFLKFHSSNGVRTVIGKIGPVEGVRMLLKNGYRHVYMARGFAKKNGFIPKDAEVGKYGYGGIVNIGQWPLTLGRTTTTHTVYLSEETHFDVILGRSFMEKRGIKTDPLDMTSVVCLDTGESLECEVVIIRDGKGEIVTVT